MQFETIHTITGIEDLSKDWRELLGHSTSSVPFLTPEYIQAWWEHLGGGEWDNAEVKIIIARGEDDGLIGIAPLFLTHKPDGRVVLMFLGSYEISDFLDFITRPEDLRPFLDGLFAYLSSPNAPKWDCLDLYNILDDSPTLAGMENVASEHGWGYQQTQLQPAPHIQLPDSWDGYLSSMKKKQRHELRRKMRNAANHIVPVDWYLVQDETSLDGEMETMFAMMKTDHQKQDFLTSAMETQMKAIAKAAFAHDWLQLAVLKAGRETAAMQFNFDFDNRIWGYNSGVDPKFRELSPGVVLLGNVLQRAIEDGRAVFDFMRGDEAYKYRMGATDRFVMRAVIRKL